MLLENVSAYFINESLADVYGNNKINKVKEVKGIRVLVTTSKYYLL
jgi:hypothetical protein